MLSLASIDGFSADDCSPFRGFSPELADRVFRGVSWLGDHFDVSMKGIERLPRGGAVLVGNHACGFDGIFPIAAIARATGRHVWVLGEHLWWRVPYLRRLAAALGTVDGTPRNLDSLLARDELVLVYPGGIREALKPRELRYRLLWGHRYGFVRAAIKSAVPLVPLAAVGPDEIVELIGNAFERGERWLGRAGLPIPRPSRLIGWPRHISIHCTIGEPIVASARVDQCNDESILRRVRREVEGALHELIDVDLARRHGIELGGQGP